LVLLSWALRASVDPSVETPFPGAEKSKEQIFNRGLAVLNSHRRIVVRVARNLSRKHLSDREQARLEYVTGEFFASEIEKAASVVRNCMAGHLVPAEQIEGVQSFLNGLMEIHGDPVQGLPS